MRLSKLLFTFLLASCCWLNVSALCTLSGQIGAFNNNYPSTLYAHPTGAHGTVTYQWNTGATTSLITVTTAGLYTCILSDTSGCIDTLQYTWAPCAVHATLSYTHTTNNVYTFQTVASGGTAPYDYGYKVNGVNVYTYSPTLIDTLLPGTYTVCVTDTDYTGCTGVTCDTVQVLPINTCHLHVSIGDTMDFGGSPTLVANIAGGSGNYSIQWSDGSSGYFVHSPINGAVYCMTVTDLNNAGCSATVCDTMCSFNAVVRDSISLHNNFFTLQPQGASPYTVYWTGIYSSQNLTFTTSNTMNVATVFAIDGHGCFFLDTLFPHPCTLASALTYTNTPTNHYTFTTTSTGGAAPYNYAWYINGFPVTTVSGNTLSDSLPAGSYTICVKTTDANSCFAYSCDTFVVSTALNCHLTAHVVDTIVGNDTMLRVLVNDATIGASSYSYSWSPSLGTADTTPFIQGVHDYCVTVTDNLGCTASSCINTCTLQGYAHQTPSGSGWNQIASAFGGVLPYHYLWSNGDTTAGFYTTVRGLYTLTITDASGCSVVSADTLGSICYFSGSIAAQNQSATLGILTATVYNPVGPVSYHWSNGASTGNILTITQSGTYCVTATDSIGCQAILCDSIVLGCTLHASIADSNFGNHYILDAVVDSGTAPYSYQWGNAYVQLGTSHSFTVVQNGMYYLTVTDANGCSVVVSDSIFIPCNNLHVQIADSNYGSYHILNAITLHGTPGYSYAWRNSSGNIVGTGQVLFAQQSDVYCVAVSDTNSCTNDACDTVQIGCTLHGAFTYTHNVANLYTFTGTSTGSAGTVSYFWYVDHQQVAGGATYSATLTPGIHNVCISVADNTGCSDTACQTVTVTSSGCTLAGTVTHQINATYAVLTAHATGAHGTVNYHWTGSTSNVLTVTASGAYCVTLTDSSGCTAIVCDTVTLTGCHVTASITDTLAGNYHILTAIPSGGTAPYSYHWSINNATTQSVINSASYHYVNVTVTDANGCSVVLHDTTLSICTQAVFIHDSITANYHFLVARGTGFTPSYHWNTGATQNVIVATTSATYCVTATDINGCTGSACDTVNAGCNLHAAFASTHNISNLYTFTGTSTGGSAPLTYTYYIDGVLRAHGPNSAYSATLASGTHNVCLTVRDSARCADSICHTITVGTTCTLAGYITDTTTSSFFTTHKYTAVVLGGTAPYTYHWSISGSSGPVVTTLGTSITINVTVTDANGCSAVLIVGNPCAIQVLTAVQNNGNTGSVSATVTGYHGPLSYHWSNGYTSPTIVVTASGVYCVTVTDSLGCTGYGCQSLTLNNSFDTICGTVFADVNANGVEDGTDHGLASQVVYLYQGSILLGTYTTNASGQYHIGVHIGTYTLKYFAPSGDAVTIPLGSSAAQGTGIYGTISVTQPNHYYCGYNFGVRDTNITISGYVYFDANGNGIKDAGETGVANEWVHVGPHWVYTNSLGYYVYVGPADTYSITYIPSSPFSAYTVTPSSHFVNASVPGTVYTGNDFGLYLSATVCNISTTIIPVTTITAGYPSWYYVYVSNYGTNVASGTMTFYYDPALIFTTATPMQTSVNTTSRFVTFNYSGLLPGQYTMFEVDFLAATTVVPGQSTFEMATATDNCIESNFYDNTDTIHQVATGSWDPNVKAVTPSGEGPQGLITRDQELRYTLNFQNTGNAPAVNVVLKDSIPVSLDMATFHIVGASHPDYAVQIDGHQLVCRFSQIMLPDSGTDEAGSHGFISFALKPVAGIADGAQIQNTASIYFDYNDPVQTNATLNTIDYSLSVKDMSEHATITVMPNPFSEYTTIRVTGADIHDATLDVYNALGQIAGTATPADGVFTLSRGALSSGIYTYHITQSGRSIGSGKLVVQ